MNLIAELSLAHLAYGRNVEDILSNIYWTRKELEAESGITHEQIPTFCFLGGNNEIPAVTEEGETGSIAFRVISFMIGDHKWGMVGNPLRRTFRPTTVAPFQMLGTEWMIRGFHLRYEFPSIADINHVYGKPEIVYDKLDEMFIPEQVFVDVVREFDIKLDNNSRGARYGQVKGSTVLQKWFEADIKAITELIAERDLALANFGKVRPGATPLILD
jgi:hypothetical protein